MSAQRNLRSYTRGTTVRLIIGGAFLLVLVGNGLIWLLYGPVAALQSLICMGTFLIPIGLIALALTIMEWIVRKNRDG
jgi:hypothetical protein